MVPKAIKSVIRNVNLNSDGTGNLSICDSPLCRFNLRRADDDACGGGAIVGRVAAAAVPEDPDYAWGASSVSPKQMLLVDERPGSPNCDVHGRDLQCPLDVDSGRQGSVDTGRP
jgi:hypothetical protein